MTLYNTNIILDELGWRDGFHIPVANEENTRLEREIESKTKYEQILKAKLESMQEHLKTIKKHSSNIMLQQSVNQKLLNTHTAQIESEDHFYRLSSGTESNLRQEAHQFEREQTQITDRISSIKKNVSQIIENIKVSKKAIKFDENCITKWQEELTFKKESNQLIEKFMKDDAKKYKELEQKRQKIRMELETYRQSIYKTVNEVNEIEIVLDRTAKLYTQAVIERRQLINQWTRTVTIFRQKDHDIQSILLEMKTLREIAKEKINTRQEMERFLNNQIANNKELEDTIKLCERKLLAANAEVQRITKTIDAYTIDLKSQKADLKDLARRAQQFRIVAKRQKIVIGEKTIKIEELKKRIVELNAADEEIDNQKLNIADKAKQLEKMIEREEGLKNVIVKKLNSLQSVILRTTKQVATFNDEKIMLSLEKQSEYKKADLLAVLYVKEQKILAEKKDILYNIEFDVQKYEIHLERVKGHVHDAAEMERKQMKIEELQTTYSEKLKVSKLLQTQIASLENDMRKISVSLTHDNKELEHLQNKKEDLVLLTISGEKRLHIAKCINEEQQVEENILCLRVSKMESLVLNIEEKVYNLEKYRIELEAALQERKVEIRIQNEALIIQKRIAMSENSNVRVAIGERASRIRQLQMRFDCGITAFGSTPDGSPITTTYLKIQSAQEKYMLQERGDKLDQTIRKTEREIQCMENTLRIVNASNDKYKDSLGIVDQTSPEQAEQKKINEEMYKMREQLKETQNNLRRVSETFQRLESEFTEICDRISNVQETGQNKSQYIITLKQQIDEQNEKLLRAGRNFKKIYKVVQQMCSCTGKRTISLQEKDTVCRQLQEQNVMILHDIAEFIIRHMEVEIYVKKLLDAKNIQITYAPQSRHSLTLTPSRSVGEMAGYPIKLSDSTSLPSARDSIGSVITLEPSFTESSRTWTSPKSNSTNDECLSTKNSTDRTSTTRVKKQ